MNVIWFLYSTSKVSRYLVSMFKREIRNQKFTSFPIFYDVVRLVASATFAHNRCIGTSLSLCKSPCDIKLTCTKKNNLQNQNAVMLTILFGGKNRYGGTTFLDGRLSKGSLVLLYIWN